MVSEEQDTGLEKKVEMYAACNYPECCKKKNKISYFKMAQKKLVSPL